MLRSDDDGEGHKEYQDEGVEESLTCWICQGESTAAQPLLEHHVCRCRGSLGAVHQRCINEWVFRHQKTNCPSCAADYTIVSTLGQCSVSLHRMDDDVPSVTRCFHALKDAIVTASSPSHHSVTSHHHRNSNNSDAATDGGASPAPPSSQLLPYPTSRLGKILFVGTYFVVPTARRVAWLLYLAVWKLLLMPLLYGHIYYHGSMDEHHVVSNGGPSSDDGAPLSLERAVSMYGLGLVLVIAYRGSIQAWYAWHAFLAGGGDGEGTHRVGRGGGVGRRIPTADDIERDVEGHNGGQAASEFTMVESVHATLTWLLDKVGWQGSRRDCGLTFLCGALCEIAVLSSLAYLLRLPHSLRWMAAVATVVAILWRCVIPIPRVRKPTERLDETFARRMEGSQAGRGAWFVTYLCDMLAFSVLLPIIGGYTLHFALGPRLVTWPPALDCAVFSRCVGGDGGALDALTTMATTTVPAHIDIYAAFLPSPVADALHRLSVVLLSWSSTLWQSIANMPAEQLPSFLSVMAHWFAGTVCLMTLVRYEASVMVPLFHPGVDLFFIRSVDLSEEATEDDPDFAWRFVLSQVFDADPLRVLFDFLRVGVIESCALIGFVAFPVQAIWYLTHSMQRIPYDALPVLLADVLQGALPSWLAHIPSWLAQLPSWLAHMPPLPGYASHKQPLPLGVYRSAVDVGSGGAPTSMHWSGTTAATLEGTCPWIGAQLSDVWVCPTTPLGGDSWLLVMTQQQQQQQQGAPVLDWTMVAWYALLFGTVVACLCTFPMQRVQLTVLRPIATALGDALGLRQFLFDETRLRLVDAFLENKNRDELIMPRVPHNRMFVRRERFFSKEEMPLLLKLRLAIFAVGFYVASTTLIWAMPVVAGASIVTRITQTSLGFMALSMLLPFLCVNPILFVKAVGQLLLLLLALTVGSVVQAAIAAIDIVEAFSSIDALVTETYEFLHTVERNVGRYEDAATQAGMAAATEGKMEVDSDPREEPDQPQWSDDES